MAYFNLSITHVAGMDEGQSRMVIKTLIVYVFYQYINILCEISCVIIESTDHKDSVIELNFIVTCTFRYLECENLREPAELFDFIDENVKPRD